MLSTIFELHCLPGNSNLIWYHVNLIKVKMTCNMFVNAQLVKMQILLKRFFLVNCKSTEKFFRNLIILSTTNWMNSISLHEPVSYSIPHQEQSLFILETSEWLFLSHQIICTHQHSDALIGSLFLPDSCYCKTSMYTHTALYIVSHSIHISHRWWLETFRSPGWYLHRDNSVLETSGVT